MARMHGTMSQWARKYPSLRRIGVATQHFPRYVNRRYSPHSLDVVLLTCIVSGRGRHHMGRDVYEESGGSLAVTHYQQEHDILTDPSGMEIYNIYLDLRSHDLPPMPAELRPVLPELLPLDPVFHNRLNRRVRIKFDDPGAVNWLVRRMHEELAEGRPGCDEAALSLLRLLLIECCRQALRSGLRPAGDGPAGPIAWLENLRRTLDTRHSQPLNLAELSERLGMSASHICRAFKRYVGKTVMEYLSERRVQAAMIRLRGTDEKVAAIALESGFADLSTFNRTFKRLLGCSPRAYREGGATAG